MWIDRFEKKNQFFQSFLSLKDQVLLVRGARQVGKTSFLLKCLDELHDYPRLLVNGLYATTFRVAGREYLGRDFFGLNPSGEDFLRNIELHLGGFAALKKPVVIFIDEADRHPPILESIQTLAAFSDKLKFVLTGSNLENVPVTNAATGRKRYFDLYPITFVEFLRAGAKDDLLRYLEAASPFESPCSEYYHDRLNKELDIYLRLGGMPRVLDTYFDPQPEAPMLPDVVKDLAMSIEENVKSVLGEKTKLYEYEDVLRTLARLSLNTLKFARLQVNHAGRSEAKRLVAKTVGARVAHKIRLWESETDLSKYVLFDSGLVNYLLNGADVLKNVIAPERRAVMLETFVASELIARLPTRDDLQYWKSGNRAEVEFLLQSPQLVAIEGKTTDGRDKSLQSFALFQKHADCLVKIADKPLSYAPDFLAKLPNHPETRRIPLLKLPHYLVPRLLEFLERIREKIK